MKAEISATVSMPSAASAIVKNRLIGTLRAVLARLRSYPHSDQRDQRCCVLLPLPGNEGRFVADPECINITTAKATTITHPMTMIHVRLLRFGPEFSESPEATMAIGCAIRAVRAIR